MDSALDTLLQKPDSLMQVKCDSCRRAAEPGERFLYLYVNTDASDRCDCSAEIEFVYCPECLAKKYDRPTLGELIKVLAEALELNV